MDFYFFLVVQSQEFFGCFLDRLFKIRFMDDFFFVCDISSFLICIFSDFNLNNYCQEVRVGLEFWYSNFEGLEIIFVNFGCFGK